MKREKPIVTHSVNTFNILQEIYIRLKVFKIPLRIYLYRHHNGPCYTNKECLSGANEICEKRKKTGSKRHETGKEMQFGKKVERHKQEKTCQLCQETVEERDQESKRISRKQEETFQQSLQTKEEEIDREIQKMLTEEEIKRKAKIVTQHCKMRTITTLDALKFLKMLNTSEYEMLIRSAQVAIRVSDNRIELDSTNIIQSLISCECINLKDSEPKEQIHVHNQHNKRLYTNAKCLPLTKEIGKNRTRDQSKQLRREEKVSVVKEEERKRQEETCQRWFKTVDDKDKGRKRKLTTEKEMKQEVKENRQLREEAEKSQKEQKKGSYSKQLLLVCFICLLTPLRAADNIGESVTVELTTKPILFEQDVHLVCTIQTSDTLAHMAWIKIPNGETIAVNNETTNNLKYQIDMNYESSAMKYKLTIRKFAQSDVNALYRCDSGFLSQYENLQLNKEDYIAMPEKNETEHTISIGEGYLRGTIEVNSVYPELDNCVALFGGEDITRQLKIANSSTTLDSMFYNMVIEISHQTEKCKGMINVTCSVGIKRIQLMTQYIDECSNQMQEKGIPEEILAIVLSIVSLVIIVAVCYVYVKSQCCLYCLWNRRPQHESNQENITTVPLTLYKPAINIGDNDEVEAKILLL